jgi:putative membrane protein
MMNWYGNGNGWMGGGGMIFMGLFWILLIGVGIWLVTWLTRRDQPSLHQENPRQALDRRFAAGEIDATAYAQARRLIESHSSDLGETK